MAIDSSRKDPCGDGTVLYFLGGSMNLHTVEWHRTKYIGTNK